MTIAKIMFMLEEPFNYVKVAEIETSYLSSFITDDILEEIFYAFQNDEESWSRPSESNPAIKVIAPFEVYNGEIFGHRSMIPGDLVIWNDRVFRCDMPGFKEI